MVAAQKTLPITSASMLFAKSQGSHCHGDQRCHWCGSPTIRAAHMRHDDEIPPIAKKNWNKNLAKYPQEPYQCQGCWLWRRPGVTATFLTLRQPDEFHKKQWRVQRDRQTAVKHSWFITDDWAYTLEFNDRDALYKLLLSPPKRFVMALLDGEDNNRLHLALLNDHSGEIFKGTEHQFTVNNVPHTYTALGLDTALRGGAVESSGVRALLKMFGGNYTGLEPLTEEEVGGRGPRSVAENRAKKKV